MNPSHFFIDFFLDFGIAATKLPALPTATSAQSGKGLGSIYIVT
jgi:hypothetical protein